MEEDIHKKNNFLIGLSITLGTIVIGLISYVIYSTNLSSQKARCEYNGWAYASGESFKSADGCNYCSCNNGEVVCTEMACDTSNNQ